MTHITRSFFAASIIVLVASSMYAQSTNTFPFPMNPPVGIGTFGWGTPQNALHINFNDSSSLTMPAIIRLSEGQTDTVPDYGILGLMPINDTSYKKYSSIAAQGDLVLHQHFTGDIIVTNYTPLQTFAGFGTAIRFATTGDTNARPFPPPAVHDIEHLTIMGNGNLGIDLPPQASGSMTGLDSAADQIQIGGGAVIPPPLIDPGYLDPIPGLTIYGGNRYEGMTMPGYLTGGFAPGGTFPLDWRYIAFNLVCNHNDSSGRRNHRIARMASSDLAFSDAAGGLLNLTCSPYDTTYESKDSAMHLFNSRSLTFQLTGNEGMQLWCNKDSANPYYHLFDVYKPGYRYDTLRSLYGMTYIHTPVCISIDSTNQQPNFTNLSGLYPDIGDDTTFDLVVGGPVLVKELFILDSNWADYVLDPNYPLKPLSEVENFMKTNRHLPDIPPASALAKTGVPIGRTEEAITKQLEEAMLYIGQLSDQNKNLSSKLDKIEKELEELENQKGKQQ